jgi:hypothetical protein
MKLKKRKDQSINVSFLLGRENKIIMGGRGWVELVRMRIGGGEERIRYGS